MKCLFRFPSLGFSEMFIILLRIPGIIFIHKRSFKQKFLLVLKYFKENIFGKSSKIKYNENSSYRNWVVPCRRRDVTKLIVAYHIFEYD